MKTKTEPKIPLISLKKEDLKIFCFITRPVQLNIQNEGIHLSLAFNLEDAAKKINLSQGLHAIFKGSLTIQELLTKIKLDSGVSLVEDKPVEPKKMNKKQFVYSLMLASDKFVKDEKDKKKIKKIIEKCSK